MTCIFSPGLMLSVSRTSRGMTTWYFGETVTVFITTSIDNLYVILYHHRCNMARENIYRRAGNGLASQSLLDCPGQRDVLKSIFHDVLHQGALLFKSLCNCRLHQIFQFFVIYSSGSHMITSHFPLNII